jgi:hypothetical protein
MNILMNSKLVVRKRIFNEHLLYLNLKKTDVHLMMNVCTSIRLKFGNYDLLATHAATFGPSSF